MAGPTPVVEAYAQQSSLNNFLSAHKTELFNNTKTWLEYHKLKCPMSDNDRALTTLRNTPATRHQPSELTHSVDYLAYDWGSGAFAVQPGAQMRPQNARKTVEVSFGSGAVNVIKVMTQSREDMTGVNNNTFRGTKLVPAPAPLPHTTPPNDYPLLMKTSQTSGCRLGFGQDIDDAIWAIHIQPAKQGAGPAMDMYGSSDLIKIDMMNGRQLEHLRWLTPYMYYTDPLSRDVKPTNHGRKTFSAQIVGVPAGNHAFPVPSWNFFIQLFVPGTHPSSYTVIPFNLAEIKDFSKPLVSRPTETTLPQYGKDPPAPPSGPPPAGPPTPPDPTLQLA